MSSNSDRLSFASLATDSIAGAVATLRWGWLKLPLMWALRHRTLTAAATALLYAFVAAAVAGTIPDHAFLMSVVPVIASAWVFGVTGAAVTAACLTFAYDVILPAFFGSPLFLLTDHGGALVTLAAIVLGMILIDAAESDREVSPS